MLRAFFARYAYAKEIFCQAIGAAGLGGSFYISGIATSALTMVDCYMENCVVKATDHDAELLGAERVKQSLRQTNRTTYVQGFGRAYKVTKANRDVVGIKNCEVCYDSYQIGYNPLTASVTRTAYVVGVVSSDFGTELAQFNDITVELFSIAKFVGVSEIIMFILHHHHSYTFVNIEG